VSYRDSHGIDASDPEDPRMPELRERELSRAAAMKRSSREPDGLPPVERALSRCDEQATRLLELTESLHHRLGAVLGPDRPEPAMGEVRSGDDYSPLAGRLEALADRLQDAAAQLGRTTRRIEL
jgi:hypothetical protein